MSRKTFWSMPALLAAATPASAHTGHELGFGFGAGFGHPFGGLDHVLAMVAVGLLAAQLGGRAVWALPLSFLSMMAAGGGLGLAGYALPLREVVIALSTVAFGAAVAFRLGLPVTVATVLAGAFALFHGQAHGAEIPANVTPFGYGAGFVAGTAFLHGAGLALGMGLGRFSAPRLVQATGSGVALAGLVLLLRLT